MLSPSFKSDLINVCAPFYHDDGDVPAAEAVPVCCDADGGISAAAGAVPHRLCGVPLSLPVQRSLSRFPLRCVRRRDVFRGDDDLLRQHW